MSTDFSLNEIFQNKVRVIVENRNLSLSDVAKSASEKDKKLAKSSVQKVMDPRVKNTTLDTVEAFAAALNVDPYFLLGSNGDSSTSYRLEPSEAMNLAIQALQDAITSLLEAKALLGDKNDLVLPNDADELKMALKIEMATKLRKFSEELTEK